MDEHPTHAPGIDALFVLACDCIRDGCSNSDPGIKWDSGRRDGSLYCTTHKKWVLLLNVIKL